MTVSPKARLDSQELRGFCLRRDCLGLGVVGGGVSVVWLSCWWVWVGGVCLCVVDARFRHLPLDHPCGWLLVEAVATPS